MLHGIKEIKGFEILAQDGAFGSVYDFYFHDEDWDIVYLVADTGNWLPGRRVLLSPVALGPPDRAAGQIPVKLTKDRIKHAPSVGEDEPVSRQFQIKLHEYFGWRAYGGGGSVARTDVKPGIEERTGNPNLRSAREVTGYHIQAPDGEIGHVEDFILDDAWKIRYLVINTRNWLPGRTVLIAPLGVEAIHWEGSMVHVNVAREKIRSAPEYDPSSPISPDYEESLYHFYGWSKYWDKK
jgi:hypothetical protein